MQSLWGEKFDFQRATLGHGPAVYYLVINRSPVNTAAHTTDVVPFFSPEGYL